MIICNSPGYVSVLLKLFSRTCANLQKCSYAVVCCLSVVFYLKNVGNNEMEALLKKEGWIKKDRIRNQQIRQTYFIHSWIKYEKNGMNAEREWIMKNEHFNKELIRRNKIFWKHRTKVEELGLWLKQAKLAITARRRTTFNRLICFVHLRLQGEKFST